MANIECCQNQNTKTLQQSIANLKNELLSKNEIIATPTNNQTDLLKKRKSHTTKITTQTPIQPKIATRKFIGKSNPAKPNTKIFTCRA